MPVPFASALVAALESLEPRRLLSATNSVEAESLYLVQFEDQLTRRDDPDWLLAWQADFLADIESSLQTDIALDRSFTQALNAVSLLLTPAEAESVQADPRVTGVLADGRSQLQSNSADSTGARDVWTGAALSESAGTFGEGILIGIIDSGIDLDNPSFAAVGPVDGFVHTNPFGEGQYLGLGDPNHPDYDASLVFNSKVVGAYDFTSDTAFDDPAFADHGTSVAGIAAGNFVNVTIPGTTTTTEISGVAPHANIIAYDVCDSSDGCSNVAIVAAVDQAILNGVDVINMSIGGPTQSPWSGVMAQAMWKAHEAGIFVAVSAGNDGPGPDTLSAPADAPWVTAVAAGRVGEETQVRVSVSGTDVPPELQNLNAIRGQNVEVTSTVGPAVVRHTANVTPGDHLGSSAIGEGELTGQIALIDRGDSLFAVKVANAEAAGAVAVVIVNNVAGGPIVMAGVDDAGIPAVMISREDGQLLRQFIESRPDARLTLHAQTSVERAVVAGFSSRGENEQSETLAPHITAPGSDFTVIAPRATLGSDEWDYFSGTSAASPHVAGAAALLLAVHPDLTPSEVQSALQLTAENDELVTAGLIPASPFDGGSGFLNVAAAVNTGLVLDESSEDFRQADPLQNGDTTALNVASFVADNVDGSFQWSRVVRSLEDVSVTWSAAFESDEGLHLSLAETEFTVAPQSQATLQLTATVDGQQAQEWLFGEVRLTPDHGGPSLEFPVAVRATQVPEIRLIASGTGTDVSESGTVDQYEIQLATPPAGTVTLEITAPDDLQISSDGENFQQQFSLIITDGFARTISVRAVDDAVAESTHRPVIAHRVTASTSAAYPVSDVVLEQQVQVFDNEIGTLTLSGDTQTVIEGGDRRELTLTRSAGSDLTESLTVNLSAGDQLAFFDASGDPLPTVTIPVGALSMTIGVAAVDDFLIEQATSERITVSAPQFTGAFVDLNVLDNDVASIKTIETNGGTLVSRLGSTDSFTVQLRAEPRSAVEVSVASENPGLVLAETDRLVFTPENWMVPQTVTVTGRDDDGTEPDVTTITLTVDPSVSDNDFDSLPPVEVAVDVVDTAGDLPQIIGPRGRTLVDPPTYRWAPVDGALSYDLYVERVSDPGVPILDINVAAAFHEGAALGLGGYRFWVRARLSGGGTTAWIGDRFQITTAPELAELPYFGTDPQPEIRWSQVGGATEYQIYITNVTTGQTGLVDESGLLENRFVPASPFGFGVHRIWVRGLVDGLAGDWSAPVDYYVGPVAQGPVRSTFERTPEFSWSAVAGAATYEFFLRTPGGGSIVETVSTTSFVPASALDDGRHVWWVRPISAEGRRGPWSEAAESWIGGRTSVVSPDDTSQAAPDIIWETVDGAASYNVFLNRLDQPEHITTATVNSTTWNPAILADGSYRVWVQPVQPDGEVGFWSVAHDFTIAAAQSELMSEPLLPVSASFANTPQLTWSPAAADATYEVYLTDGATTQLVGGLTTTSWTAPDVGESSGRWWVRAVDSQGRPGPWSESSVWNTLGRAAAEVPSSVAAGVRFAWSPVLGADRYIIQVDNLSTGESQVIRQDDVTESAFVFTGDLPSGRYRFWVRAIRNADPTDGFWSLPVDFTVA